MAKNKTQLNVEALRHPDDSRKNLPTAEQQAFVPADLAKPIALRYPRNPDLDPQLVWRGKDAQDGQDLVVHAPPLYIQEKIQPKALVDDLLRQTKAQADPDPAPSLFADFNGLPDPDARTEFYQHDAHWTNRMILGDSLQVMASLAEREGLRGKVQCIYMDPPYGIKFNSNFQWSTASRDVKDGNKQHITREPEQVKAFRDTWRDGIHSYLSYLRDRLTLARELLADSGSIFVQIGDENVHRVRAVMDEVFGEENFVSMIQFRKTVSQTSAFLPTIADSILWFSKNKNFLKYRNIRIEKSMDNLTATKFTNVFDGISLSSINSLDTKEIINAYKLKSLVALDGLDSQTGSESTRFEVSLMGFVDFPKGSRGWRTSKIGIQRLKKATRLFPIRNKILFGRLLSDFGYDKISNLWMDTMNSFEDKKYVVQTNVEVIKRCLLMATDPGDLVLDPTCGSGTTAHVAEQWGRRWITIDTSRVALALARARLMGARYAYYLLQDSPEGQRKEAELAGRAPGGGPTQGRVRQGFVYQRVPHITLKSIANNAEIDALHAQHQPAVLAALAQLNAALRGHSLPFAVGAGGREKKTVRFDAPAAETFTMPSGEAVPAFELLEWEVPREAPEHWPAAAREPLRAFWQARILRQKAIDASIQKKAEHEYLYDRPYEDKTKVRVAGPFTVESLAPHRMLHVGPNDELLDPLGANPAPGHDFGAMVLHHLEKSGVQQAHKADRIRFERIEPWPGRHIAAIGHYAGEAGEAVRAGIHIGPEFGTLTRTELTAAAREAAEAGLPVLVACGFNFDATSTELNKLGPLKILKARMNADLHMAQDLKNTGSGNLFVVFGEPDIEILATENGLLQVEIKGVDVFNPRTQEVRSSEPDEIAMWFLDTDYNQESFFVRHAYFLGAADPYKALRTTLKADIDEAAWATLHSATSRPFPRPAGGYIAVKVINHLGDEVLKVFQA